MRKGSHMRRTVRLLVPMLLLIGVVIVNTGNAGAAAPQAKWTVMVYMSGDNNLEDFISSDIETEFAGLGRAPTSRSSRWPTAGPATTRATETGSPPSSST